ncbi:PD-(D/E)XK nuclease-like domain-containing protein [Antrihabitans sp. YC3-6]|uniref:PD-(D/E)XK nuclease-like domain-containing protein n=2 Tax=Antrihabitans stalagmiti TaxID=2799499 RepID=A0A934U6U2_9NOCA|nr:PD-(D/E)XK nuclease-like domain-containing protein [Antrihabitans stalagmiti]
MSLSSSGARRLIEASPRKFRFEQDNPPAPKKAFEYGHAAHALVLGVGAPLVEIPFDEWRTKESKELVAAARAAGATPLKPVEFAKVHAMAAELQKSPIAQRLFAKGVAEQSIWWDDPYTGVRLRARFDWRTLIGGRLVLVDYKSTIDAAPDEFAHSANKWGYYCQHAFYRDGAQQLGLDDDPGFIFIAQEKEPPYEVTAHQYGPDDIAFGHELNQRAIRTFADCMSSGVWPTYPPIIHDMRVSKWTRIKHEESFA